MQPQVSQDLLDRGPLQDGRDDLQACWEADGHERLLMAASGSARRRQEADLRPDGPAGQSQLAATDWATRSRPAAGGRGSRPSCRFKVDCFRSTKAARASLTFRCGHDASPVIAGQYELNKLNSVALTTDRRYETCLAGRSSQ